VFEIYHLSGTPLADAENQQLERMLEAELSQHDLVVAADYGHTMLGPAAIEQLSQDARFLAVNTQANAGNLGYHTISKYPRADYVSLAEQELRLECRGRTGDLQPMLMQVAAKLVTRRAAVTRGAHGCISLDRHGLLCVAPALATKVVDRTGAGDAFLAISSLCAVQHAPLELMAFLGNVAGAEAVATIGTGTAIDPLALARHVESLLK
jgi:sugar/nucleoside kinase (ribokinase family)